ncbi:MAG: iron response transcriptional regulator IrrA [Pseudomonadota bacterium]
MLSERLRAAGLRPTRQRLAIADALFSRGDRHISAEVLLDEVLAAGSRVSLATIYNTLHQLEGVGLVRELAVDGTKRYFDTNTSNHSHFFIEETAELVDIPGDAIDVGLLPEPPPGTTIAHVDVVVRVRRR